MAIDIGASSGLIDLPEMGFDLFVQFPVIQGFSEHMLDKSLHRDDEKTRQLEDIKIFYTSLASKEIIFI